MEPKTEILIDSPTIEFIIEKLESLQEAELINLTDWDKMESTEDRLFYAKGYVECGNLINYLKTKIEENGKTIHRQ